MKYIQRLIAILLAMVLLCSLAGCGNKEDDLPKKYQEIIDDFIDGQDPEERLMVGEEHRANGAFHLTNGPAFFYKVYSSNENVVTVSSKGKVTAVGEGTAYVIIVQKMPILGIVDSKCTKYTVYTDPTQLQIDAGKLPDFDAVINDFSANSFNCITLSNGQTHTPNEALWLSGSMGGTYSSNESVVTVSESGTVTAVGIGTAYVVIAAGANVYRVLQYTVTA